MPSLALQPLQFTAHPHPQERIERRQRLVKQQDLRLGDQRAGERDALLLAAGELRRQPARILAHRHQLEQLAGALVPRRLVDAAHLQGEGDVVDHGQMRKQRVGLEHHRRAALGRRQVGDVLAAQDDVARADRLVARDHPQGRGLAATGRAEQAAIGAGRDFQVDGVDRQRRVIALGDGDQFEGGGSGHGVSKEGDAAALSARSVPITSGRKIFSNCAAESDR